jgi:hypothetical protein
MKAMLVIVMITECPLFQDMKAMLVIVVITECPLFQDMKAMLVIVAIQLMTVIGYKIWICDGHPYQSFGLS